MVSGLEAARSSSPTETTTEGPGSKTNAIAEEFVCLLISQPTKEIGKKIKWKERE